MVNVSKLSASIVTGPNLTNLNRFVTGVRAVQLLNVAAHGCDSVGVEGDPKLPVEVLRRNVEILYYAHRKMSRSTARQTVVMQLNETGRSECRSVMERIGI